jgi:hypothetical protein
MLAVVIACWFGTQVHDSPEPADGRPTPAQQPPPTASAAKPYLSMLRHLRGSSYDSPKLGNATGKSHTVGSTVQDQAFCTFCTLGDLLWGLHMDCLHMSGYKITVNVFEHSLLLPQRVRTRMRTAP